MLAPKRIAFLNINKGCYTKVYFSIYRHFKKQKRIPKFFSGFCIFVFDIEYTEVK